MKILLCTVRNPANMSLKAKAFGVTFPLGLGYIAACLLKDGYDVRILDNAIENLTDEQLKAYLTQFQPDVVGFTTYTFSFKECLRAAAVVKAVNSQCTVVLGGPHATYLPHRTLSEPCVDIVVKGEGEVTMSEIVRCLQTGNPLSAVSGISYKDRMGTVIDTPDRAPIADLDSLPFPAYELVDIHRYYSSVNRRFSNRRFGGIITSRGCPYACTFCSHKMFGKKIRFRSPERVVAELEFLSKTYDIGEFIFLDDTFTTDFRRTITLCDLILKRRLDIVWSCNSRADHASQELYQAMYNAGCRGIHIGVESASQEMLDAMKKGVTTEQIESAVTLAKRHIGHVVCGFIFGMPGDTIEKARATIQFAKRLNPDYATFNIAIPIPGSEVFEDALRKGIIKEDHASWQDFLELFSPVLPVVELSEIKRQELVWLAKRAFREFYFRPSYIAGRLRKVQSSKEIFLHLRGLQTVLKYIFCRFNDSQDRERNHRGKG